VAAILSLNGAKNSYKNHGGPAKGGGALAQGPPKYATGFNLDTDIVDLM